MSIWQLFESWRMGSQRKRKYTHILGEPLLFGSTTTATQETPDNSNPHSLAVSPPYDPNADELYRIWILLSPREQQVTALTCLKYTNPQIAFHLGLSKTTVRTYLEKVLNKLGLRSKADLRVAFAVWDFSQWERPHR